MMMLMLLMLSLWLQPAVMSELEGVVVLDADDNHITSSYDDVAALPTKLVCY